MQRILILLWGLIAVVLAYAVASLATGISIDHVDLANQQGNLIFVGVFFVIFVLAIVVPAIIFKVFQHYGG